MASMIASLDAHTYLRARMSACSFTAGWRSLLLRAYEDNPDAEAFTTPATADHLIVLVTQGRCNIEGLYRGQWRGASYGVGSIGMTAPGEEVTLRWQNQPAHSTLQLHLPAATIQACADELFCTHTLKMPHMLATEDPLLQSVLLGLADAMNRGYPDLYAESAAQFITTHLLVRHAGVREPDEPSRDVSRMRRVHEYMRAHIEKSLTLQDLAKVACVSRFHLIRMFKQVYDQTPHQHLLRLRIEEASRRLRGVEDDIAKIAIDCGFGSPAHFAAAFRKHMGVTPSAFREQHGNGRVNKTAISR
ncbi:MAG: AraC family transcriptional regulator [Steroidobacter sp.]